MITIQGNFEEETGNFISELYMKLGDRAKKGKKATMILVFCELKLKNNQCVLV